MFNVVSNFGSKRKKSNEIEYKEEQSNRTDKIWLMLHRKDLIRALEREGFGLKAQIHGPMGRG